MIAVCWPGFRLYGNSSDEWVYRCGVCLGSPRSAESRCLECRDCGRRRKYELVRPSTSTVPAGTLFVTAGGGIVTGGRLKCYWRAEESWAARTMLPWRRHRCAVCLEAVESSEGSCSGCGVRWDAYLDCVDVPEGVLWVSEGCLVRWWRRW